MASRVGSDNPRVRAQNQQMPMEKESNIRIDGLIDDSSIRFPFSKTEQGLLQFPESQLFCCDSRLAVLVADPAVKVTVLRRWDVDEKYTDTTTGQASTSTSTVSQEESAKTVINNNTTTTSSTVKNTTQQKQQQPEAGESRESEEAGKSSVTTKTKKKTTTTSDVDVNVNVTNGIVSSTPNLSSQSQSAQSYSTTTTTMMQDDRPEETGTKFVTTAQMEPMSSSGTSGVSMGFKYSQNDENEEETIRSSSTKNVKNAESLNTETSELTTKPKGPTVISTSQSSAPDTPKPKGPTAETIEESSQSRSTETLKSKGPITVTTTTSQRWAPDTSEIIGPTGMTTEETSESWATSTPKAAPKTAGSTTSNYSQSYISETSTSKTIGPKETTTTKVTSKTIGPSRMTTTKTSRTQDARASCGLVDNEESLKEALENFVVYSRTMHFMNSCPDDVLAMLEDDRINLRSERDAFRSVNEWILHDPVTRKQHAAKLMSGVRFSLMTLPELLKVVHASRYLSTIPEYRDQLLEAFIWKGACHCNYSEYFLDFEPTPRCDPCSHQCQCQCHGPQGGGGTAATSGAEVCCCACHCQAPGRFSVDTIGTEFQSRSL